MGTAQPGQHAQNTLRLAIANNGNDWDRKTRQRIDKIREARQLEQEIAGHARAHEELSTALALIEQIVPAWQANPGIPDTIGGEAPEAAPSRVPALYKVTIDPLISEPPAPTPTPSNVPGTYARKNIL